MFVFKDKIMLAIISVMGFLGMNGTVAMDPPPVEVEEEMDIDINEGKGNDPSSISSEEKQAVQQKVENQAQQQFQLSGGALPIEALAAIFVKLEPRELVIASLVNYDWRQVAFRVMGDNLAKWGKPSASPDDMGFVTDYLKVAYSKECPAFSTLESIESFFTAVKGARGGVFEGKRTFDYDGKTWHIDDREYWSFHLSSGRLSPTFRFNLTNTEFIPHPDQPRLRCYYQSNQRNEGGFKITTLLADRTLDN